MKKVFSLFFSAALISTAGTLLIHQPAQATSFDPVAFCNEYAEFFGGFHQCLEEVTFEGPDGNEWQPPSNREPSDKDNHCSGRLDCPA